MDHHRFRLGDPDRVKEVSLDLRDGKCCMVLLKQVQLELFERGKAQMALNISKMCTQNVVFFKLLLNS